MGFKRGLIVGMGIGYVLGAKAGRERYEEIRAAWGKFMGNPQVQAAAEKTKDAVETGAKKSLHAVEEGVEKATQKIKDRVDKDGDSAPEELPATVVPPAGPTAGTAP